MIECLSKCNDSSQFSLVVFDLLCRYDISIYVESFLNARYVYVVELLQDDLLDALLPDRLYLLFSCQVSLMRFILIV